MLEISIGAEKIFEVAGFPVTNTLLTSWLVVAFFIIVSQLIVRKVQLIPAGIQNVSEFVVEGVLGLMGGVLGSRSIAEKYFPLIATIFLFIIISNWFGILPGFGSIGFHEMREGHEVFVPMFRSVASDLNVTMALAIVSVFSIQFSGIVAIGFAKHMHKYFTLKNPVQSAVGLLEFISEIAKMISFSFRLFGNVFAGEVLLIITGFLVPYFIPVPFLFLEIFVGFIQALVFAMLTVVFLGMAITEHGVEEEHH
ncbi:MAG: ATP synthase F0 subunit A [Candidatus Sungbacteria bacterium RIFCSPLOWO2_01_FULL_47_32]|uniref:ATP synthase subunit a n=1 Tax=Candidatus Sungbacteria bacterium RIFCSPHIGHO2_01_FULL_47_32 TaxID=1802264 RepID=A0A1G2K9C2_9BACT|nr:MAG: ATP synthase F0 subunit A [Candidatus Sungbacteria bacterium RIFCSPHIGHO2_01_FULL_47_32]OHA06120.1 MAG: ATP synthase F0 subunit A [Candidatus Sungbacteria bacterium RIFCSPLOWO2_01_FULL_47_32]